MCSSLSLSLSCSSATAVERPTVEPPVSGFLARSLPYFRAERERRRERRRERVGYFKSSADTRHQKQSKQASSAASPSSAVVHVWAEHVRVGVTRGRVSRRIADALSTSKQRGRPMSDRGRLSEKRNEVKPNGIVGYSTSVK
jgi:hypothetical protein